MCLGHALFISCLYIREKITNIVDLLLNCTKMTILRMLVNFDRSNMPFLNAYVQF